MSAQERLIKALFFVLKQFGKYILGCVGLLAFFGLILLSGSRDQSTDSSSDKHIGDIGVIRPGSYKTATLAVDEQSYDEALKAQIANDTEGKTRMILIGKLFLVDPGSKCQVLDFHVVSATMSYKVRILDGKQSGRTGYISADFVH